jgi:ferredoxin
MATGTDGGSADGDARLVTLEWNDGREERVAVSPGECIVDAAEAAGVTVPYGCLYGACATCTAELLDGDVEHTEPIRGLKPDAVREGYVLPCIATPRTDCRIRVGHSIQAEVVGTPWK